MSACRLGPEDFAEGTVNVRCSCHPRQTQLQEVAMPSGKSVAAGAAGAVVGLVVAGPGGAAAGAAAAAALAAGAEQVMSKPKPEPHDTAAAEPEQ